MRAALLCDPILYNYNTKYNTISARGRMNDLLPIEICKLVNVFFLPQKRSEMSTLSLLETFTFYDSDYTISNRKNQYPF